MWMYRQKNNDRTLLLMGGLAAAAALLYMNKSSVDSLIGGSSGGSDLGLYGGGSPTYGTTPVTESTAPIIYQIPAEGGVTFPQASTFDLAGLLALLGAGQQVQANQEGVTKKEAAVSSMALDAGDTYINSDTGERTTIKKPFLSATATKSSVPVAADDPGVLEALQNLLFPTVSTVVPGAGAVVGGVVGGMLGGFSLASMLGLGNNLDATSKKVATTQAAQTNPIGTGVNSLAGSTQVNAALGYSGQYVRDPATGLLAWNANNPASANSELGGFGLSRDPKTGEVTAYQRDVYISTPSGTVYNPVTKSGNPQTVADVQQATFTHNAPLTDAETKKTAALLGLTSQDTGYKAPFVTASVTKKTSSSGDSGYKAPFVTASVTKKTSSSSSSSSKSSGSGSSGRGYGGRN